MSSKSVDTFGELQFMREETAKVLELSRLHRESILRTTGAGRPCKSGLETGSDDPLQSQQVDHSERFT